MSWIISHAISAVKSETPQFCELSDDDFNRFVSRNGYYLGINDLRVSADPVTCRTRLNGKRIRRFAVLGKASRFLSIPDHFGRINDNWRELPAQ